MSNGTELKFGTRMHIKIQKKMRGVGHVIVIIFGQGLGVCRQTVFTTRPDP